MSSVVKDTHHDEHPSGIMRWITTTNHKDIGTLYLWFAMIMFFIGGLMALVIRSELFQPGLQFVDPQFFNSMTTMHALVMIFGVVMPAFTGLANWMIPIMIGGPDMALPRMNNWSFWIMPFGHKPAPRLCQHVKGCRRVMVLEHRDVVVLNGKRCARLGEKGIGHTRML